MTPASLDHWPYVNINHTGGRDLIISLICAKLPANESRVHPQCSGPRAVGPTGDLFLDLYEVSPSSKVVVSMTSAAILAVALAGNVLVLLTVLLNKMMWTAMHMFIVSLAISDLFVSTTSIPLNIVQVINTEWTMGSTSCQLLPFFMQVSIAASTLTLCCMAVERYVAIVHPLRFTSLQTTKRSLSLVFILWTLAFASATPYPYYYRKRSYCMLTLPNGRCKEPMHDMCLIKNGSEKAALNLHWLTFTILFLFPVLVMGVAYGIIIYKLWFKASVGVAMISAAGCRTRYKKKAIKMLLLVVALFLVCWMPLLIFDLVTMTLPNVAHGLMDCKYYLQCLALSSTAYNPIVYAFMNQKFRTSFAVLLTRQRPRIAPMTTDREELRQERELHHENTANISAMNSGATLCSHVTGSSNV